MKRLLAALIFVSVFLHSLAPLSFAQTQATESALPSRVESDVPNDYSTHTQMLIIELLAAISCQLSGVDPVNPSGKCLGVNPETGKIGFMENGGGGAIAVVTKMMIFTFDIPISTHDYTSYTASNFGIVKSSFAQNVSAGFNGLSPLLPVWVAFRNVIYVLFVIAFMVVGMGIMFRRNIDPKTVMTVQNSIPRVIIILVLVTFSFAIAGFLIDMMYLAMYLLYGIVNSVEGVNIPGLNPTNLAGSTPFGATGSFGSGIPGIAYDASRGLGSQISAIFDNGVGNTIGGVIAGVMLLPLVILSGPAGWIGGALSLVGLGGGIAGLGNEVLGLVGGVIAFLIIVIAIISALFRLWIALIKSYLFILIDVAIAPIWIAGSLIPGSPWTIGSWFRHILKYILVFPLTFAMFLLGTAITQLFSAIPDDTSIFAPPFIGNSLNPKHLGSLLGLGLILMLPEVINMVQSIIKAPENKFQQAIPQAFGLATGVIGKATGPVSKEAWAHDKAGNAEGFVNRRIWEKFNTMATKRAQQGKGGGIPGIIANRMMGPDRETRMKREKHFSNLREIAKRKGLDPNMESSIPFDPVTNYLIPPNIPNDYSPYEIETMRDRHNENTEKAQERLGKYREMIPQVILRINLDQDVSENENIFQGLYNSLFEDPLFKNQLGKTRQSNPGMHEEDLKRVARDELRRQLPLLLYRYDLKERVRQRNTFKRSQQNTPPEA